MLFTQAFYLSFGRNTLKEWLFMTHLRQVLLPASFPSHASFLRESGSSRFSASYACSGFNIVWMPNKAALFDRSIQYLSSTVIEMMLLMNPSIDASLESMFTARGSDFEIWSAEWRLSFSGSMFLCGELRYVVSNDSSLSRLFPMSIPASLVVVYSYGAGVVPKSGCRQRKATLSTILIQVDVVLVLAWIWR